jgi:hypothetical protein
VAPGKKGGGWEDDTWSSPFLEPAADVLLLLCTAIKFADLGHVTKPLRLHEQWTMMATNEFWQLGDKEKALGVAVSPLCDRSTDTNVAKSQCGFFKYVTHSNLRVSHRCIVRGCRYRFVCNPFYEAVADLVDPGGQPFARVAANYAHWVEKAEQPQPQDEVRDV